MAVRGSFLVFDFPVSYSTAVSPLPQPFLFDRYCFITVRFTMTPFHHGVKFN